MNKIYLLSPWVDQKYKMAITSLKLIKYYLEDHGYSVEIIDCAYYPKDLVEVVDKIRSSGPKPIVGVTAYTRERFFAYELIRTIKRDIPDVFIVVGGRHFGFLAEETLKCLPEVDVVVRGEGEVTMNAVCNAVKAGHSMAGIEGLSYRDEKGRVIHNPDRPLEDDLDQFRVYDKNGKSDLDPKHLLGHTKVDLKNQYFPVHATRGCPNRCVYCSLTASKVRYRSIDSIVQEIEDKINATGIRNVSFADSSLTISKKFVTNLCNAILEKNLGIRWRCYSRVNIDMAILRLMRNAGLDTVEIGLETGSPKVLKSIRKNIKLDQVYTFCKLAHELGIRIWVFCMVSLPDETMEDAEMTLSFIKDIAKYITNTGLQTCRITPDAALCGIAKERGALPENFNWFDPYQTPYVNLTRSWDTSLPIYMEHLSAAQISEVHKRFKEITSRDLANFTTLWQGIRYNMSLKGLKRVTPKKFLYKVHHASKILAYAIRNNL